MNILRNKQEVPEETTPTVKVADLEPGTAFRIGKKLFLKADGGGFGDVQAVRLTNGSTDDDVNQETVIDGVVEGTFTYV